MSEQEERQGSKRKVTYPTDILAAEQPFVIHSLSLENWSLTHFRAKPVSLRSLGGAYRPPEVCKKVVNIVEND